MWRNSFCAIHQHQQHQSYEFRVSDAKPQQSLCQQEYHQVHNATKQIIKSASSPYTHQLCLVLTLPSDRNPNHNHVQILRPHPPLRPHQDRFRRFVPVRGADAACLQEWRDLGDGQDGERLCGLRCAGSRGRVSRRCCRGWWEESSWCEGGREVGEEVKCWTDDGDREGLCGWR